MSSKLHARLASLIAAAVTIMAAASSCVDRGSASSFAPIAPEGWAYGDTIQCTVERADTLAPAALAVAVRNNNAYPYSNLWLEVTYNTGPRTIARDTVNLILADPYGRWTGKGFGAGYQSQVTVNPSVVPPPGSRIGVRHIMRVDTLTGIEQVGIILSGH